MLLKHLTDLEATVLPASWQRLQMRREEAMEPSCLETPP